MFQGVLDLPVTRGVPLLQVKLYFCFLHLHFLQLISGKT